MLRLAVLFAAGSLCFMAQNVSNPSAVRYTADGQLILPGDYREWVFLSSGLGMTYQAMSGGGHEPAFTNVFVNPSAYRSFLKTGTWPDQTMLVLEVRASANKGSINKGGSYQSGVLAVEGEVKDRARFPGNGWAFFAFGKSSSGKILARPPRGDRESEDCYSCHLEHGAVDNTFVQFYPVLLEIARQKFTLRH